MWLLFSEIVFVFFVYWNLFYLEYSVYVYTNCTKWNNRFKIPRLQREFTWCVCLGFEKEQTHEWSKFINDSGGLSLCHLCTTRRSRARWSHGRTRGRSTATAPAGPALTPSSPWSTWLRRSVLRFSSWASWPTPSSTSKKDRDLNRKQTFWVRNKHALTLLMFWTQQTCQNKSQYFL